MKLAVFKDGYRYIVGPKDQSAYSVTDGFDEFCYREDAVAAMKELEALDDATLQGRLRRFYTDERFEAACDSGVYGPDWD
jgi:hypothetical protein